MTSESMKCSKCRKHYRKNINDEFARVKAEEEGRSLTASGIKNGTENGTERIPEAAIAFLQNYKNKKRATAERIMRAIVSNSHITILEITKLSGSSERTVKRYLKEFQEADVLRRAGSDTSGEWILS